MVNQPYAEGMAGDYTISNTSDSFVALYEYNCYNQLVGVDTNGVVSSYTYAPDGLRHSKTVGGNTTTFAYDNGNVIEEITTDGTNKYYRGIEIVKNDDNLYYLYNGQGDVSALTDTTGTIVADYTFDAYGNQSEENTIYNPFGYRGEYQDLCSGLIYLRNRYYDPSVGRFISEDTHWNPGNMIYGDGSTGVPNVAAIMQSANLYVYASNNPIAYVDPTGNVSEKIAAQRIKNNASYIIAAGKEFGVNPAILAATIYAEQVLNVNYTEGAEDFAQAMLGMDCSVGISQVRISTAKKVEDAGYIAKTYQTEITTYMFTNPFTGNAVYSTDVISRESHIYDKLTNDNTNICYASAYLALIQDKWKGAYSEIDGRTAVLATLYNIGENGTKGPNSNPGTNEFGEFAKANYYKMRELLGLE